MKCCKCGETDTTVMVEVMHPQGQEPMYVCANCFCIIINEDRQEKKDDKG